MKGNTIRALLAVGCALLVLSGTVAPFLSPVAAANADPDAVIVDVDAPDSVTVGESFEVTVTGANAGGDAGQFSTMSVSSPGLDDSDDGNRIRVTEASDHSYSLVATRGDAIYDANGNRLTANYALAEAGSDGDSSWAGGESRDLSVEFTPEETGTFVFYVRVTLTDDENSERKFNAPSSSPSRDQQDFYVKRFEVEVREERNVDAAIVDLEQERGTVQTGDTVDAETTVENTGNREHTFYVGYSVRGPDGEWRDDDGTTHESVTLAPGERETVHLQWNVESDAPSGSYDVQTAVYAGEDGGLLTDRKDVVVRDDQFDVGAERTEATIVGVDPATGTSLPGDVVTTEVTVENTGTTDHRFYVGYGARGPDGTVYDDDETTHESVYLTEGERETVTVEWTVPSDVPEGRYDLGTAVYREETADGLLGRTDDRWFDDRITVEAPETSAQIRDVDPATGTYRVGDTVRSRVLVENDGDVEHRFYVGYSVRGPDGEWRDAGGSTHESVALDPGEKRWVTVSWQVPDGAPTGTYDLRSAVYADRTSDGLVGRTDAATVRDTFSVASPEVRAEFVEVDLPTGTYEPGDSVRTEVLVENTGDAAHTYFVGYSLRGPDGTLYDEDGRTGTALELASGERRWVTLSWVVPEGAPAGEYDVVTKVYRERDRSNLETTLDSAHGRDAVEVTERTGVVAVTVLGPDGSRIAEALVTVGPRTGRTDASGVVTFDSVPVGDQPLAVEDTGFATAEETVEVESDDPSTVKVRLDDGSGQITGLEGIPGTITLDEWYTAEITLRNTGEATATFVARADDYSGIEFRDAPRRRVELAPGEETTVELDVRFYGTDTAREFTATLETAAGTELDSRSVEVTPGGTRLQVGVVDSEGRSVSGAEVRLVGREIDPRPTDDEGLASFRRLDPGTVLVKVSQVEAVGVSVVREVPLADGDVQTLTVEIPRTGEVSGRVLTETGTGLTGVTVEINGRHVRTDDTGLFSFEDEFAAGPYLLRVKRDGETIHRESIEVVGGGRAIRIEVDPTGDGDGNGDGGIISNAQKGAIFGEVGVQTGMSSASTVEYLVGWLGGSVVPVADAFADTRDCILAPNAGLASNFIDCGGAVVSTAGSAGTVVGAITSPTGIGAAVGVGSFSIDTAEDVVTVTKHFITWTAKNPEKGDEAAAAVVSLAAGYAAKAPGRIGDVIRQFLDELTKRGKASLASKVRTARLVTHLGRSASKKLTRNAYRISDDWYRVEKVGGWLSDVRSADGYDDLTDSLKTHIENDDWKNVRGTVFEAKVASDYKTVEGTEIRAIGRRIDGGELDVITTRGDLLEVKASQEWRRIPEGHDDYEKLGEQLDRYKAYRNQENLEGQVAVVFPVKPSNDVYDLLSEKGVDCLVNSVDGGVVPCYREPASISIDDPISGQLEPAARERVTAGI